MASKKSPIPLEFPDKATEEAALIMFLRDTVKPALEAAGLPVLLRERPEYPSGPCLHHLAFDGPTGLGNLTVVRVIAIYVRRRYFEIQKRTSYRIAVGPSDYLRFTLTDLKGVVEAVQNRAEHLRSEDRAARATQSESDRATAAFNAFQGEIGALAVREDLNHAVFDIGERLTGKPVRVTVAYEAFEDRLVITRVVPLTPVVATKARLFDLLNALS